jgi:hypothetical protein
MAIDTKVGELERLRKLYGEMADDHLLDMAEDLEDLTQEARLALEQELLKRNLVPPPAAAESEVPARFEEDPTAGPGRMQERSDGFGVGVPGVFPGAATAVEEALEPDGQERAGMVRLVSFYDGLQLSSACTALAEAGIEPAIEESAGDATVGTPTSFHVWVDKADVEPAQAALRGAMGLFPLAEASEGGEDEAGDGLVGSFETAEEATEVKNLLVEAGFAASVEPGTEPDEDGLHWTNVKVPPRESGPAIEFLERRMSLEG